MRGPSLILFDLILGHVLIASNVIFISVIYANRNPKCTDGSTFQRKTSMSPVQPGWIKTTDPNKNSSTTTGSCNNDDNVLLLDKEELTGQNYSQSYGRISETEYTLTPEQIETFFRDGCVVVENVLTEEEIQTIEEVFTRFITREIDVPDKDLCDISKPFGIPYEHWSIVNCMLPTKYYPPFRNNIFEQLTNGMAQQLFQHRKQQQQQVSDGDTKFENDNVDMKDEIPYMVKDYDQFLNKRSAKEDAIFAWHQDMAYWPGTKALNTNNTDTCTFSLAIDDSTVTNGCLRYIPGSGTTKQLRRHQPLFTKDTTRDDTILDIHKNDSSTTSSYDREEGHALTLDVDETRENIQHAPVSRGSITIHDEYVVHGSGGNYDPIKERRTYVIAYRANEIVQAERKLGFTHSHNDVNNWDTFLQEQQQ
jgi:phytanoyl-CoA hydroxylase